MNVVLALLLCVSAFAQDQTGPAFEVASIKPHVAGGSGRTGIQEDPGQIVIENLSLRALVSMAFGLKGTQQLVAPNWLNDLTFDIVAKTPAGYKHEQLRDLVRILTRLLGAPVQDETGLAARYDLKLEWTPDSSPQSSDLGPSLFTALQEQMGLRLQSTKIPATVVVVDRIERAPTAN